jgi:hypothetical protein
LNAFLRSSVADPLSIYLLLCGGSIGPVGVFVPGAIADGTVYRLLPIDAALMFAGLLLFRIVRTLPARRVSPAAHFVTVVLGPVPSIALVLGGRAGLSVELLSIALALAGGAVISLLGIRSDRTGRYVVIARRKRDHGSLG